jgi:hypothetical protein
VSETPRKPWYDDEGPGPADRDLTDDESTDTARCPHCGAEVYEDADKCPVCGEWILRAGVSPARLRPWWWIALALAAAGLLLWAIL